MADLPAGIPGRHRVVMTPGRYTELFFLDEATGLAAGHRPCCECRRGRFLAFRDAWVAGNGGAVPPELVKVGAIDDWLHAERIEPVRMKQTFTAGLDHLPDGVFVTLGRGGEGPQLVLGDELLAWSPGGYTGRRPRPRGEQVTVLTPKSTVAAIRAGYVPEVHPSALGHVKGRTDLHVARLGLGATIEGDAGVQDPLWARAVPTSPERGTWSGGYR